MLFSEKENIFMCLVAFQKMFRKIFSDVWLCFWKYLRKHILYLLLTFSRLPNEYIISFIPQNTNKTQNPEKNHQIRTKGEIAIGRSRSLSARLWSRSARSRSRSPIAIGAIAIDADRRGERNVLSLSCCVCSPLVFWLSLSRVLRKSFEGKISM